MSGFGKFFAPFVTLAKQPIESFIRLETADSDITMVAEDGSLLTYVKVDGSRQVIGQEEYAHILEAATVKLGSRFDRPGHALQVFFTRNPARARSVTERETYPSKVSARNIGLELEDVLDERARHLSHYMVHEECYFVLWTRPNILPSNELKRAAEEQKSKNKWVAAHAAQNPTAALEPLRARHKSYVLGIESALNELGIRAEIIKTHDIFLCVRLNQQRIIPKFYGHH